MSFLWTFPIPISINKFLMHGLNEVQCSAKVNNFHKIECTFGFISIWYRWIKISSNRLIDQQNWANKYIYSEPYLSIFSLYKSFVMEIVWWIFGNELNKHRQTKRKCSSNDEIWFLKKMTRSPSSLFWIYQNVTQSKVYISWS